MIILCFRKNLSDSKVDLLEETRAEVRRLGGTLRDSLEIIRPTSYFFWIRKTGAKEVIIKDKEFMGFQWKFHGLLMFSNHQFPS